MGCGGQNSNTKPSYIHIDDKCHITPLTTNLLMCYNNDTAFLIDSNCQILATHKIDFPHSKIINDKLLEDNMKSLSIIVEGRSYLINYDKVYEVLGDRMHQLAKHIKFCCIQRPYLNLFSHDSVPYIQDDTYIYNLLSCEIYTAFPTVRHHIMSSWADRAVSLNLLDVLKLKRPKSKVILRFQELVPNIDDVHLDYGQILSACGQVIVFVRVLKPKILLIMVMNLLDSFIKTDIFEGDDIFSARASKYFRQKQLLQVVPGGVEMLDELDIIGGGFVETAIEHQQEYFEEQSEVFKQRPGAVIQYLEKALLVARGDMEREIIEEELRRLRLKNYETSTYYNELAVVSREESRRAVSRAPQEESIADLGQSIVLLQEQESIVVPLALGEPPVYQEPVMTEPVLVLMEPAVIDKRKEPLPTKNWAKYERDRLMAANRKKEEIRDVEFLLVSKKMASQYVMKHSTLNTSAEMVATITDRLSTKIYEQLTSRKHQPKTIEEQFNEVTNDVMRETKRSSTSETTQVNLSLATGDYHVSTIEIQGKK